MISIEFPEVVELHDGVASGTLSVLLDEAATGGELLLAIEAKGYNTPAETIVLRRSQGGASLASRLLRIVAGGALVVFGGFSATKLGPRPVGREQGGT